MNIRARTAEEMWQTPSNLLRCLMGEMKHRLGLQRRGCGWPWHGYSGGIMGQKKAECSRLKIEPEVRQWRRPRERVAGGRCEMEGRLLERGAI